MIFHFETDMNVNLQSDKLTLHPFMWSNQSLSIHKKDCFVACKSFSIAP